MHRGSAKGFGEMFMGWNRKSREARPQPTWKDVHRALARAKVQAKAYQHDGRHLDAERARGRVVGAERAIAVMDMANRGIIPHECVADELLRLAEAYMKHAHTGVRTTRYDHRTAAEMLACAARIADSTYGRCPSAA